MKRPELISIGRVVIIPYDPAQTRLTWADRNMDPDEFRALRYRLPQALRNKWNYWEIPSRFAHSKRLHRLIIHTKAQVEPPKGRILTRLKDMVWERMIDKQGEVLEGVPRYWQVPIAFTGRTLSLYFRYGIRLGTLVKIINQWTPDRVPLLNVMASPNCPRGP